MTEAERSALLLVDVQNDFCSGGALEVPGADDVIPVLNRYIAEALARGLPVYASRDWHPRDSTHFRDGGGPWPVHCVQGTRGASFHPDIRLPASAIVVTKGEAKRSTGYSPFEDGHTPEGTPFVTDLRERRIDHLYVGGLATDYCVRHAVIDALATGLKVTVLTDAIAGVDPHDSARALAEMRQHGAEVTEHGRLT